MVYGDSNNNNIDNNDKSFVSSDHRVLTQSTAAIQLQNVVVAVLSLVVVAHYDKLRDRGYESWVILVGTAVLFLCITVDSGIQMLINTKSSFTVAFKLLRFLIVLVQTYAVVMAVRAFLDSVVFRDVYFGSWNITMVLNFSPYLCLIGAAIISVQQFTDCPMDSVFKNTYHGTKKPTKLHVHENHNDATASSSSSSS